VGVEVAVADSDEVEESVEAEVGDGLVGGLADQRFGAIGNAHAGEVEHGDIVGAIADGNNLFERDAFGVGDLREEVGLAVSVDDGRNDAAGNDAVDDFKLVGVDVIDAEALLEMAREEGESAGEDSGFVAEEAEGADEAFRAIGERDGFEERVEAIGGKALQKGETAGEAFVESELAAHGGFRDAGDLIADSGEAGQLVDDFALDEGGIHIKNEEAAITAEDAFALEADVDGELLRGREEFRAHGELARGVAADGELDAGVGGSVGGRELAGETVDAIDVHSVGEEDGADAGELLRGDGTSEDSDDEVAVVEAVQPVLERGAGDSFEAGRESELVGAGLQRGFEGGELCGGRDFDEDAERKRFVNDSLTDVEEADVEFGEDAGELRGEAWGIVTGKVDEHGFMGGCVGHRFFEYTGGARWVDAGMLKGKRKRWAEWRRGDEGIAECVGGGFSGGADDSRVLGAGAKSP